jgi:parallel beta-helix repeat protein
MGKQDFEGPGGGILLKCKKSSYWLIEENNVTDNNGPGIYIGGGWNNLRYNTVTYNHNRTGGDMPVGHGIAICRQDDWPNGGRNNTVEENIVCDNEGVDIYVATAGYYNTGDENTCDTAENYDDEGTTRCTYFCSLVEQPDLVIEDIKPIRWCCYCIKPVKALKGGDDSEEMSVMFIDDLELAKELGDEELRKEVAEALAKDPKLAKEVAAKLAGDDDDKKVAKELSHDPKQLAKLCCYRINAIRELAGLLDTELTAQAQHEMSDQLDMIVSGGCCGGCCGRFIAYKLANNGTGDAGWSLSNLTVNGSVRSVDIVRPLDTGQRIIFTLVFV